MNKYTDIEVCVWTDLCKKTLTHIHTRHNYAHIQVYMYINYYTTTSQATDALTFFFSLEELALRSPISVEFIC